MRLMDFEALGGRRKVFTGQSASFDALGPSVDLRLLAFNVVETAGTAGYLTFYEGQSAASELAANHIRKIRVAANGENTDAIVPEVSLGWRCDDGVRVAITAGTHDVVLYYIPGTDGAEAES